MEINHWVLLMICLYENFSGDGSTTKIVDICHLALPKLLCDPLHIALTQNILVLSSLCQTSVEKPLVTHLTLHIQRVWDALCSTQSISGLEILALAQHVLLLGEASLLRLCSESQISSACLVLFDSLLLLLTGDIPCHPCMRDDLYTTLCSAITSLILDSKHGKTVILPP
ncbi:hypothetical protein CPB86DRAFT_781820 [Serendipita vermifera]|nr:hypothetical protein CPB86DRAFT_781820 [Serendipita vermifera]